MKFPDTLLDPSAYKNLSRVVEDALAMTESGGDPDAKHGSHYGLLQMRNSYLRDAGYSRDAEELLGDAKTARDVFRKHMDRYSDAHEGEPVRMATVHHRGIGFAKKVFSKVEAGMAYDKAVMDAAENYSWADGVTHLEYIARFCYWLGVMLRRSNLFGDTTQPERGSDDATVAAGGASEAFDAFSTSSSKGDASEQITF